VIVSAERRHGLPPPPTRDELSIPAPLRPALDVKIRSQAARNASSANISAIGRYAVSPTFRRSTTAALRHTVANTRSRVPTPSGHIDRRVIRNGASIRAGEPIALWQAAEKLLSIPHSH
jgi:hypothetical protein